MEASLHHNPSPDYEKSFHYDRLPPVLAATDLTSLLKVCLNESQLMNRTLLGRLAATRAQNSELEDDLEVTLEHNVTLEEELHRATEMIHQLRHELQSIQNATRAGNAHTTAGQKARLGRKRKEKKMARAATKA